VAGAESTNCILPELYNFHLGPTGRARPYGGRRRPSGVGVAGWGRKGFLADDEAAVADVGARTLVPPYPSPESLLQLERRSRRYCAPQPAQGVEELAGFRKRKILDICS
jgi:hypothetical protein